MNERERRGRNSNPRNLRSRAIARTEEDSSGGSSEYDESLYQYSYTSRSYEELRARDEELFYKEDEDWTFITEEEYQAQQLAQNEIASVPDAGWGEIADTENVSEEKTEAENEIAQEVLAGALQGDFNDDPTFWSDVGQIVTGLIPIAGQLGDARDLIHALDDITNKEGYKKIGSWAALVLIVIGFVPGVGDAIKSIGKRGIRYLDNNRILKRIGQFLGDNIISPILERVGDLTAPLVNQIKDAIRRKLAEAQEIAQQLGEGADNVIDDVTGRPQLATEGVGNVPVRMENNPLLRGNEPMQSTGGSGGSGSIPSSVDSIKSRISSSPDKFDLRYTDSEINNLIQEGKKLGLDDATIEDLIFVGSRKAKPMTTDELISQMDNYVNTVSKRGYPYKFTDLGQFSSFKSDFLSGLQSIGIPIDDVRIQGSSLRTPNANDVDLVTFIDDIQFDRILTERFNNRAKLNDVGINLSDKSHEELISLAQDIQANPQIYNSQAQTFAKAMLDRAFNSKSDIFKPLKRIRKELTSNYPNLNIEAIAIQTKGGGFDLKPSLKL